MKFKAIETREIKITLTKLLEYRFSLIKRYQGGDANVIIKNICFYQLKEYLKILNEETRGSLIEVVGYHKKVDSVIYLVNEEIVNFFKKG